MKKSDPSEPAQMRSWDNVDDRRAATLDFAAYMNDHDDERDACCRNPDEARRQFALLGRFYLEGETLPGQPPPAAGVVPIPRSVVFKVYNATDAARDDLAVFILPSVKGEPTDDPLKIWIGAWPPWPPR